MMLMNHSWLHFVTRGAILILIGLALFPVAYDIQVVLIAMGLAMAALSWVPRTELKHKIILLVILILASAAQAALMPTGSPYPLLAWMAFFVAGMVF